MTDIIPSTTGLDINGVAYRYTIDKSIEDAATVYIRNQHLSEEGFVYERNDVWDGLPGNTKVGYDPIPYINSAVFGNGEIGVEGAGVLSDVQVYYSYSYNLCTNPLAFPYCPGYLEALHKYLLDNGLLSGDIDDPYYDEWVRAQLEREPILEETQSTEVLEDEEIVEELDIEAALSVSGAAEKIADVAQQEQMLRQLASINKLDNYYTKELVGGNYVDAVQLADAEIQDNRRALNNLINDSIHRDMIRSQYDRD